jgi:membrane fusion protein (multidrug efflux system)
VTADQATALTTVTQLDPIFVDIQQSSDALLRLRRSLTDKNLTAGKGAISPLN